MELTLTTDDFIELLIELDALQHLFNKWLDDDDCQSQQLEILRAMIAKKIELRDQALAEFRVAYPELDNFDWAKPDLDA